MNIENNVRVFTAEATDAGLSLLDGRSPQRGAVRTRGISKVRPRDGSERIKLDIGQVQVSISAVRDTRRDVVILNAHASCKGMEIATTVRADVGQLQMDSGVIRLRNQVYQFLIGLLPGEPRVLVDLQPIDEPQLPSIEDRVRITEKSWNSYAADEIKYEVAWKSRNEHLEERHIVCHPASRIKTTLEMARRLSAAPVPILICGPSGAGKEPLAHFVHENSRVQGRFVPFNCATLPEELLDSELFGKVPGAYTDAKTSQDGLFVRANKGTLFLDEIGELPAASQAKLLRVLEDQNVKPVGADFSRPVDVRVISATNRDLWKDVKEKRFRLDLYYRLSAGRIEISSLEQRLEDIPSLLSHYSHWLGARNIRFESDLFKSLFWHSWPGNVRELRNFCQVVMALQPSGSVSLKEGLAGVEQGTAEGLNRGFRNYQAATKSSLSAGDEEIVKDLAGRTDRFLGEARQALRNALEEGRGGAATVAVLATMSLKHLKCFTQYLQDKHGESLSVSSRTPTCHASLTAFRMCTRPNEAEDDRNAWVKEILHHAEREMLVRRSTDDEETHLGNRYALLEEFLGLKYDSIRKFKPR